MRWSRRVWPASCSRPPAASLLLRWPWVLAFATLACIPIRIPVDVGTEDANLLLPLYAVVASLVAALGWQLLRGDARSRELGPIAASARRRRRVDRARAPVDGRPAPGRDLPRRVRAPLRPAGDRLRAPAVQPARAARPLRGAGRDRAGVRGRRALPVGHARGLLEPEAAGRQRVRALLPRQLRVLGSVDLRPLPRDRDPGDARVRPARAAWPADSPRASPRSPSCGWACCSRSRSRASPR